ncbi:hypothetical protein [Lentzea albida]|uniref:Uncharacterized protein n=1 Tax=Lentzea albida TaxID=65499 RepID=A0A1H9XB98_9PSEU|nr:hypothetical protein [Lentzea albida]SES43476.1 hypothetical protein SAMN04488000_13159 [Lentzea albida]
MSIRDWMIGKLREDSKQVEPLGDHGLLVRRPARPDAVAYCVEPDSQTPFTAAALRAAIGEQPGTRMVIVTRRLVDPDVYEEARRLDVAVETFGGFRRAVDDCDDISRYTHRDEDYLHRRLYATRAVKELRRCGHRAWQIIRHDPLAPLTIVIHDRYELTDDDFGRVLADYPKLDLDAFVITNPSAQGFGTRVVNSARRAGVPICTLEDFLHKIREPWT